MTEVCALLSAILVLVLQISCGKRMHRIISRNDPAHQSINLLSTVHSETNKCKLRKKHSGEQPVKQYAYLCWPLIRQICSMQARFYAGGRGPAPPDCGWAPRFLKVFPFFLSPIVFVMT